MRIIFVLVLLASSASCGGLTGEEVLTDPGVSVEASADVSAPDYGDEQLQEIKSRIERVVGLRADEASQCRAMPIGAKPCGGPWAYFVYSASSTDEEVLKELVAAYDARQALLNRRDGHMSTCDLVTQPTVALDDGICVAGSSSHSFGQPEVE